ncbi:YegS/Rv2252/BmrU family lipid kinase [Sphingobacterium allocomposti]|uniref:YegS/Rv2252/BmrU family lipid kinase n=1 Tax=Sphingobacterium allocomposti TaxID=415956 RepID=A0A5S5DH57_9SPHI|nr:diacylglycerol kinase family protein [Sphingobacterium composti Yoo et al. 2007 non Ten et al. 2007]TYP94688.1 YegS/Rv2252/BmrU family lipid kinase [Sphingobacterium composti Yoo et al. 2007 non Ten et al. 2007]HLS94352.1 diacylglycerol kinase family protein [Sphingobacterium sp.]
MRQRKRILFVINPISGGKKKTAFNKQVLEVLDLEKFDPTFKITDHPNHAFELGKEAIVEGYDAVVAVGGDGTINELGSAILGTGMPLGIIPEGSGNGLALYLGIPLNESAAIRRINRFESVEVDTGAINGRYFFNIAGLGFDASVSDHFAAENVRGPIGYLRSVVNVISKFNPSRYKLIIDGKTYEKEAFMISVANSPQYGNNAYIAPQASITDGVLDVCVVHQFPLYLLPKMIFHLFTKSADQSEYVEIIPGKEITIIRDDNGPVHVDGEPVDMGGRLDITIKPRSLKVIC